MRYPHGGGLYAAGSPGVRRSGGGPRRCSSRVSAPVQVVRELRAAVPRLVHAARGGVLAAPARFSCRCRRSGPPSGTRRRSPPGGRRPGRRYEVSGSDRGVDLLRGRSRPDPAPAQGLHLGRRGRACHRQDAGTGLELRADTMGAISVAMDRLTAGAPAISR
jgi:hypothetical protein